jgi:hypothetical protein
MAICMTLIVDELLTSLFSALRTAVRRRAPMTTQHDKAKRWQFGLRDLLFIMAVGVLWASFAHYAGMTAGVLMASISIGLLVIVSVRAFIRHKLNANRRDHD